MDESDPSSLFVTRNNPDNPKFRSNLNLSYVQGAFSVGLNTRYIGSAQIDPNVLTDESIDKNDIPSRIYNDLILGYHFENDVKVTATITNLADIDPPRRDEVLTRWYEAVIPLLKYYYGTGGDLNVDELKDVVPIGRPRQRRRGAKFSARSSAYSLQGWTTPAQSRIRRRRSCRSRRPLPPSTGRTTKNRSMRSARRS